MEILENFYNDYKKVFEWALYLNRQKKYRLKTISKKGGGKRKLRIPPSATDTVQKKLNKILQRLYTPPKPIHGFIKSEENFIKNIVTNAQQHIKKDIVINVDIINFFDNINFGRVRGLFLAKPFNLNPKLATKIAQLTTYDNMLPQGASTSPIISNIICKKMDHELIKFAKKYSLTFTRYADDITLSSNKINLKIEQILEQLEIIINNNGFDINPDKTRVQLATHSQIVTGLTVNRKVNVSRKFVRQIRSMLYSWHTDGLIKASNKHFELYNKQPKKYKKGKQKSFKNILLGKISFLGQVKGQNDPVYLRFLHTYYLQNSNFFLNQKLDYFEEFDLYDMEKERAYLLFTQIYDSLLVITEGVTDIIYIKEALKFFNKKKQFVDLKLRFCYFGGYADVIKFHRILYDNSIIKMNKLNELDIANIRKCVLPHINEKSKFCFVLDSDDDGIIPHFKKYTTNNHFLLDIKNGGYIEKLIAKQTIIDIIKKYGYIIDTNRKELDSKTKNKLIKYLTIKDKYKEITPVSNYIAYGKRILEKTNIAKHVAKSSDIDYSDFEDLFIYLEKINHHYTYPKKLCCNSIY